MAGKRRRRSWAEAVRPDVPVVPILLVCFLLFAFHIVIHRNGPTEGYIAFLGPFDGKDPEFLRRSAILQGRALPATRILTATCGPNGTVGEVFVREEWAPLRPVGEGFACYEAELRTFKARAAGEPTRLVLEVRDGIRYGEFIRMLDAALLIGFDNIEIGYDGDRVMTGSPRWQWAP